VGEINIESSHKPKEEVIKTLKEDDTDHEVSFNNLSRMNLLKKAKGQKIYTGTKTLHLMILKLSMFWEKGHLEKCF